MERYRRYNPMRREEFSRIRVTTFDLATEKETESRVIVASAKTIKEWLVGHLIYCANNGKGVQIEPAQ